MARKHRSKGSGTLFKRNGRGPWIARWTDGGERRERSTGTTCHATAERILNSWVNEAALRASGLTDARAEALAEQEGRPLAEHLAEFVVYLEGKGTTAETIDAAEVRIRRILEAGGIETVADLSPTTVLAAVNVLRKPAEGRGLSLKTANHYIGAARSFSRWLFREKRSRLDELASLRGFNAETDRRRVRRDLSPDEVARLLAAAENSPAVIVPRHQRDPETKALQTIRVRMTCADRVWAYRIASGTGFRAAEVSSLTPESFELDGETPTVTVEASYSKRRRRDVQPIRDDLADLLRGWLKGKRAGEPVCPLPDGKAALLLRADLRTARAAWIREGTTRAERRKRRADPSFLRDVDASERVVDFHGLRTTFISRVVDAGANLKQAMELARHSDPKLTMKTYARTGIHALGGVLDRLPGTDAPPAPERQRLRATGTTDAAPSPGSSAPLFSRQLGRETARTGAATRGDDARTRTDGASDPGLVFAGERDVVQRGAFGCGNAEGRTRTADLRVMNPAL